MRPPFGTHTPEEQPSEQSLYRERELLALIRNPDIAIAHRAFTELVGPYIHSLQTTIRFALGKNVNDLDDIVQDILCRFWEQRHSIEIRTRFNAYLCQSAKNKIKDLQKHQGVLKKYSRQPYPTKQISEITSPFRIFDEECARCMNTTIDKLTEQQRLIWNYRCAHVSTAVIAEILGVTRKAIDQQLWRVMVKLREDLIEAGLFDRADHSASRINAIGLRKSSTVSQEIHSLPAPNPGSARTRPSTARTITEQINVR